MDKFFSRPWVYRVLSLFFAVLLFAYVNGDNLGATRTSKTQEQTDLAQISETMKVPLQINANTSRYFITGYPEHVSVTVSGPNALVIAARNTQSFRAYLDLSHLKTGTHTVKVKISGLNTSLSYAIKPSRVKVSIQPRAEAMLPVQVKVNTDNLADGYETRTPQVDPQTIQISGSKNEVAKVSQVIAQVSLKVNANETLSQQVIVQAVDRNGKLLNVLTTPQTVRVRIPIYLPSKKVDLKFTKSDTDTNRVYTISSRTKYVTLYGRQDVLKEISALEVPISLKNVEGSSQRTIKLQRPKGVTSMTPTTISVTISAQQVSASESSDSHSQSSQSQSSSASSSSSQTSSSSSSEDASSDSNHS